MKIPSAVRRLFTSDVQTDERLAEAYNRVDCSAAQLGQTVEKAKAKGVFEVLREAIEQAAEQDGERIRRRR